MEVPTKKKKKKKKIFSHNSRRVVAGISNPSRILLNLVSVSQKVREIWDKFVRGWRPMKLNYDWLETKMRIWHSGRECRTTIARVSWRLSRVSRDILPTCMRTPGELWQYLQQYSCGISKCVVKYQFSVIPNENCRSFAYSAAILCLQLVANSCSPLRY